MKIPIKIFLKCYKKIFTYLHVLIFWPQILKLRCFVICLFFGRKTIISVLLAFKFILLVQGQWHIKERSWFTCLLIILSDLSVNPFQDGGGGGAKRPSNSFSPLTSTNIGISPQNFLTFSFNPLAILV